MTTTPSVWLAEFTVNAGLTAGVQSTPHTIGLANGNFLTVWTDNTSGTGPGNDVFGQIFDPEGNALGAAFQVNTFSTSSGEFLGSIAALPGGDYVVAYIDDNDASADTIRIQRFNAAGGTVFSTSITGVAGAVSAPAIAAAPGGNYMVSFTRNIAGDRDVRAVIYNGFSNAASAEFDAAQNSADADTDSDVAGLSNGSFVTAYQEVDAGVTAIEARIVDATGAPVGPILSATGPSFDPEVAGLSGGGLVFVYRDSPNNGDIRFSIFSNTGVPGASQILVAGGAASQNEPHVVALKDGGFFVVWDDDTANQLLGRRFNAAGGAVGGIVIIASGEAISRPELGLSADGRILVTFRNAAGEISQVILDPRDNVITGTAAGEVLTTQIGDTTIFGLGGSDTIFGQAGNDTIQGGFSIDTVSGGGGNDTFQVLQNEFGDNVSGGSGTDLLDLSAFTNRTATVNLLAGTWDTSADSGLTITGVESVTGGGGNDTITGSNGNNTLNGGGGNDTLQGGGAIDTVNGGAGDDVISVLQLEFGDNVDGGNGTDLLDLGAFTTQTATVNLAAGTWDTSLRDAGLTITGVENVTGGGGNDTITGSAGKNTLNGGGGNDTLLGGDGEDIINGGAGDDTIEGGFETDTIDGGDGNDAIRILEGEFIDNVQGGSGIDTLGLDNITTRGAVIDAAGGTWDLSPSFGGPASLAGIEIFQGTQADDTIDSRGASANETINGNGGNDTLFGGDGTDTIDGGAGDDVIEGGFDTDTVSGGDGNDTFRIVQGEFGDNVDGGADTDVLGLGGLVTDTAIVSLLTGLWSTSAGGGNLAIAGVENVNGGNASDTITGDALGNVLKGLAGDDILAGGDGDDTVQGGSGDDSQAGAAGLDALGGGEGNDVLNGGADNDAVGGGGGNDMLAGGAGNDTMHGGAGDDLLVGGLGRDVLTGGADADTFRFVSIDESAVGATRDLVRDFVQGADLVNLSGIDADIGVAGNQAFTLVGNAAFSGGAGELRFTQTATHTVISMDVNGDAAADSQVAFIGVINFVNANFIL